MKSSIPELKLYKVDLEDFFNFLSFDQRIKEFIYKVQELAKKRGEFLYFVGGVVRDYLYFLKNSGWKKESIKDLDIVLQGDLKGFLEALLKEVKGKILFKSQFLTYKVKIHLNSEELLIDFITARKETYEDVAKLPKVFPSDFKDDVLRRDFTINTLIIGLSPPYEGYLIDLLNFTLILGMNASCTERNARDFGSSVLRPGLVIAGSIIAIS
jgi:tRNA nucleotidyltransferase (CCA-adding enzyme)